jgi:hypothetical protein
MPLNQNPVSKWCALGWQDFGFFGFGCFEVCMLLHPSAATWPCGHQCSPLALVALQVSLQKAHGMLP